MSDRPKPNEEPDDTSRRAKEAPPPPKEDDAGIVDRHRTEKPAPDLGGEID